MTWSNGRAERARALLERYPDRRSAVMPLLYLASLEYGHVSDDAVRDVAELTGQTSAEVEAVASFYTMFKRHPVGRYLISVCTSISCYLLDADDVLEAVEEATGTRDGDTGGAGLFTVEHVECLGACGGAPALQVNYELVEGVDPGNAAALCRWLRETMPEPVRGDDLQERFGGRTSFPWGPAEPAGAVAPVPAFPPYGSARGAV